MYKSAIFITAFSMLNCGGLGLIADYYMPEYNFYINSEVQLDLDEFSYLVETGPPRS